MGRHKLKITMYAMAAMAAVGLAAMIGGDSRRDASTPHQSMRTQEIASYGGVLVPKRVRIILGFVQTLPA